jgi:glyoxylase-like metal-dependent hydrolase (beta-lactamase superfamily II)
MPNAPVITTFTLGPYATNCFVVTSKPPAPGAPCWIVDCGFEPDDLIDFIQQEHLKPAALLLTHTHLDHIAGVDHLLARLRTPNLPLYVHESEAGFCSDPMLNLSALIGLPTTCREPNHILKDGDTLDLDGSHWRVLHTPGHSPGGVCYVHDQSRQAIVGDTIFQGSIGRHDFPTSDVADLRDSIQRIIQLPDGMTIHPGHGPQTTIGEERRSNPFVLQGF